MRIHVIAAAIMLSGLTASVAEAMPVAPVSQVVVNKAVLVDYACGRGFHITPWGDCRPNRWHRPPPAYWGGGRAYGWGHRPPPPRWGRHHQQYHEDRGGPPRRW